MHAIRTVNTKRFSLNGVEYLKNYVTNVSGHFVTVFNCYNRCDVLLPPTHYNQFLVNGAAYTSAAQLQAALTDILYVRTTLGEVAADISQDNVDLVRRFRIPAYSLSAVLNAINTGTSFSIAETQSVWFVFTITTATTTVPRGSVYKYKMTGLGKGDYGAANGSNNPAILTSANLELVYYSAPTTGSVRAEPGTALINFGDLQQGVTLANWLNSRPANAPVSIQPAEDGFTIFEGTINGTVTQRLWTGASGKYGQGAQQALDSDFEPLANTPFATEIPDYERVLTAGPRSSRAAEHQDESPDLVTAYGTGIRHMCPTGSVHITFSPPEGDLTYTIPYKTENDTFVMQSDLHRPIKLITADSAGMTGAVYKLEPGDNGYWLSFNIPYDFTILVPSLFSSGTLIEGDVSGTGIATFESEEPVHLQVGPGESTRLAGQYSVFGIKYRQNTEVLLFGKLQLR